MNLRFLTVDDMPAFRSLRMQALKETPLSYMHIHDEEIQKPDAYHENMLKFNKVMGAFDEDVLVAFAFMSPFGATKQRHKCSIWGAYVKTEYRNQGVGKDMRRALFTHAKEAGIEYCLSSIVSGNDASLGMHTSLGYEVMYTEKHGLKHRDGSYSDIIHLVKWL